jgi:hypothetical protein
MDDTPKQDNVLVGFARLSDSKKGVKINLSVEVLGKCSRYVSKDGGEYIGLVISAGKMRGILDGSAEVTSVSHFPKEAETEAVGK